MKTAQTHTLGRFSRTLLAGALLAGLSMPALAEFDVAGNMSLVSDYRFRGVSQTYKLPAVQGGIDLTHSSGLYVGTWASNVTEKLYPNGAALEMDFYGGYKWAITDAFTLDLGGLYYYYPGSYYLNADGAKGNKPNNFELYAGLSWNWLSLKYSHNMTNFFGLEDSKNSNYIDLTASYPIMDKLTLVAHVGHQKVKNYSNLDYTDYKLGVVYDLSGWNLGAAFVGTNAKEEFYTIGEADGSTKAIAKNTVVLSVSKSF